MSGFDELRRFGRTGAEALTAAGQFSAALYGEPVDLSGSVTKVTMHYVDPDEFTNRLHASGFFTPVTVRGTVKLSPLGYRALVGRSHPRIRRMHAAYGRRRGSGRW